jgi:hypothetical protein
MEPFLSFSLYLFPRKNIRVIYYYENGKIIRYIESYANFEKERNIYKFLVFQKNNKNKKKLRKYFSERLPA